MALIGARRPYVAIAISLVLVAISAYLLPKLKISTSRRDLVSTTNALQRRTVEFDEKFGYTNSPVIVISGGSADDRHKVVDALGEELESVPELKSRVLGRINPEQVAEVLLFSDPKAFEKGLPEGAGPVGEKLEAGIDGWIGVLKEGLEQGLERRAAEPADRAEAEADLRTARIRRTWPSFTQPRDSSGEPGTRPSTPPPVRRRRRRRTASTPRWRPPTPT